MIMYKYVTLGEKEIISITDIGLSLYHLIWFKLDCIFNLIFIELLNNLL